MFVKLDAQAIIKAYLQDQIDGMNVILVEWLQYLKQISPVDSGDYINRHKVKKAVIVWNQVIWVLYNDAKHARILEDWVQWRVYNYHKWPPRNPSTRIYSGIWNRTYTRTRDAMQFRFKNLANGKQSI